MKHPVVPKASSEAEFCAWLDQAEPGETLEYHRGLLMIDRIPRGRLAESERQELVGIADRAMWAAERGLVHLLQKRHRVHAYSYLAVARPREQPRIRSLRVALDELADAGDDGGA